MPSIYFSHRRRVFRRDGMLYALAAHTQLMNDERPFEATVR